MSSGYKKYKQTSVESASKEKVLLMLYEGTIKFIRRAMLAIDESDIKARGENIGRAYDIIMELMNTLDMKIGGEIAVNLERLYIFINEELTRANITGEKKHLENALKVVETLLEGWIQAVEIVKKNSKSA